MRWRWSETFTATVRFHKHPAGYRNRCSTEVRCCTSRRLAGRWLPVPAWGPRLKRLREWSPRPRHLRPESLRAGSCFRWPRDAAELRPASDFDPVDRLPARQSSRQPECWLSFPGLARFLTSIYGHHTSAKQTPPSHSNNAHDRDRDRKRALHQAAGELSTHLFWREVSFADWISRSILVSRVSGFIWSERANYHGPDRASITFRRCSKIRRV